MTAGSVVLAYNLPGGPGGLKLSREAYSSIFLGKIRRWNDWNMNRGCDCVAQAVGDLFRASTGRAVFADHPLQQRFQDIHAAMAHAYLGPDPLAKAVGGYLLCTSTPEFVL